MCCLPDLRSGLRLLFCLLPFPSSSLTFLGISLSLAFVCLFSSLSSAFCSVLSCLWFGSVCFRGCLLSVFHWLLWVFGLLFYISSADPWSGRRRDFSILATAHARQPGDERSVSVLRRCLSPIFSEPSRSPARAFTCPPDVCRNADHPERDFSHLLLTGVFLVKARICYLPSGSSGWQSMKDKGLLAGAKK